MPKYDFEVPVQGKSAAELYSKVSEGIDRFLTKTPMGSYDLERDPERKEFHIDSKMATLTLVCEEERIRLKGKLSMLAAPFRGKLDEGVKKWVSKIFG